MSESWQPKPPEDERLPVGKLMLAAAAALFIFAVGVTVAYFMSKPATDVPIPLLQPEVGVTQRLFPLEKTAAQLREEQQQTLTSTGWVDRDRQLVHIPIESAIEQLLEREKKGGTR
jgi:hypothetical protein